MATGGLNGLWMSNGADVAWVGDGQRGDYEAMGFQPCDAPGVNAPKQEAPAETADAGEVRDLQSLKVGELREIAAGLGIETDGLGKVQILEAIEAAGNADAGE